jgi:hypothetical protein
MKRPSSYYAPIHQWLVEQQKTHALEGLTYRKIAARAAAALNMEVCGSTIETLAKQLGYKYRTLKQPDLLLDRNPTDSARIKEIAHELVIIKDLLKSRIQKTNTAGLMLCAICQKLGIEVPK